MYGWAIWLLTIHTFNNLVYRLKRFDPQLWLPTLTLFWGIVSVCQGLIKNKAGLFGIRFREYLVFFYLPRQKLIFPTACSSSWCCRSRIVSWGHLCVLRLLQETRTELESGYILWRCCASWRFWRHEWFHFINLGFWHSNGYTGILAYAIGKMDGVGGRKGWEW